MGECQRLGSSSLVAMKESSYSGVNFVARTVMLVEAGIVDGDLGRFNNRGPVVNNAR